MKPTDDETWTEVEEGFFAAAPPDEPEPLGALPSFDDLPAPPPRRPRREIIAWLQRPVAGAGRGATLVFVAVGGLAQRAWHGGALILSAAGRHLQRAWRRAVLVVGAASADRRYVALGLAGAIVAAGLTTGGVASRNGMLRKGATAEREAPPASGPTIGEAALVAAPAAPVAPRPNMGSTADVQAPRAAASNRHPHDRRRTVPASSSAPHPPVTASVDRETYWASESRSAAVRSSRPLFSR